MPLYVDSALTDGFWLVISRLALAEAPAPLAFGPPEPCEDAAPPPPEQPFITTPVSRRATTPAHLPRCLFDFIVQTPR
jgi:hypothetical protein